MALEAAAIRPLKQSHVDLAEVQSEQLALLTGHSIAERHGIPGARESDQRAGCGPLIAEDPATVGQVLDLAGMEAEQRSSLADRHRVTWTPAVASAWASGRRALSGFGRVWRTRPSRDLATQYPPIG